MRIVFMGTPESAVPSMRRLVEDGHEIVAVWTQPDRPAGRGKHVHQSPIKEFATRNNLAVHQPSKIRTPEAKGLFASHNAEVAVVVAYGKILPAEFLHAPKYGCINVHFSLLPKYRGAAPVNWAIVNGENETGVTTMRIVEELDAGPILRQKATTIGEQETAPELLLRLAEDGAQLISETLHELRNIEPKPQLSQQATFAPILKRADGLIDWSRDAFAIERRVRGLQPWPNAYTFVDSRRVILWRSIAERREGSNVRESVVVAMERGTLSIGCGDNTVLRVLELQPEGARRMSARDFLNGSRLTIGTIVG